MASYPSSAAGDAQLYVGVNNRSTSLSAAIDAVVTTIPVVSTTGFPTSGFVSIDLEIIAYTSVNATNFLGATRGADGSTAASHASAAEVSHNIVAAHHNALKDEVIAVEGDLVGVQSALVDSAPGSTASTLLVRIRQIVTQIKAITGTSNWYDSVGRTIASLVTLLGSSTTQALLPDGTVGAPSHSFSNDSDCGLYRVGTNSIALGTAGARALEITSSQAVKTKGTSTNDSATAGDVGEYVSASVTTPANHAATGTYTNITSISLTAGDWLVSGLILGELNGATQTALYGAISLFSGATTTDHVFGDNQSMATPPATAYHSGIVIPLWRVSVASTTTVYLKTKADYSAGTPQYVGRISAWRLR